MHLYKVKLLAVDEKGARESHCEVGPTQKTKIRQSLRNKHEERRVGSLMNGVMYEPASWPALLPYTRGQRSPFILSVITGFQEGQIVGVEDEMESNRAQLYLSFERWAGRTDEEGVERVLSTPYGSLLPVASSCNGLIFRVFFPRVSLSLIFFTI